MNNQFDILKKNRILILKLIENYSIEELNKIPQGFKNNIAWNVVHSLVTQQLLCYKFSNLPLKISGELVELYKKGTSPQKDISKDDFEKIKAHFIEIPNQLEIDFNNQIFKTYKEYTTSVNVTLKDINSAIAFNNFHEGIHLGYILALKKLI
jgi:hypothetical protein